MERQSIPRNEYELAELGDGESGTDNEPTTDSTSSNRNWYRTSLWITAVIVVIIAMAVTLAVVVSKGHHSRPHDTFSTNIVDMLTYNSTFPNRTFSLNVTTFRLGPPEMTPVQPNSSTLAQINFKVNDTDNAIVEPGRFSYFYIRVPANSTVDSADSNRAEESIAKGSVVKIASIGIRFGDSEFINVVPMFMTKETFSGIRLVTGEKEKNILIYEMRVQIPETLCDGASDGCHLTSWRAYACGRDNLTCTYSEESTLAVPCGPQCSYSPTSMCSATCQSCDANCTIGHDGPVSRRVNFGTTSGVFQLMYETGVYDGNVKVVYEDKILYESGCGNTNMNEPKTVIRYSGRSKEITVHMEPNCKEGKWARWKLQISCLYPCRQAKNRAILFNADTGDEVGHGSAVRISKESLMPNFTAYYCPGARSVREVFWNFTLGPTPGKPDMCKLTKYQAAGGRWNIEKLGIQGGDATLYWNAGKNMNGSMTFNIIGANPDPLRLIAEIKSQTSLWYAEYVGKHESGYRQFDIDGYALKADNGGLGIFPLANPGPTCKRTWSWKDNVKAGAVRLIQRAANAKSTMAFWRKMARGQMGYIMIVPPQREANCLFKDDTLRTVEDACAMKQYNGNSSMDYCIWNANGSTWDFYPFNDSGYNYVESVCRLVPP